MIKHIVALSAIALTASPALAFDSFQGESAKISNEIGCRTGKVSKETGLPDLWSCILPGAEVLKVFINEDGSGGVKNVKIMWNDWTRDTGYGLHTDREVAMAWVSALSTIYAPESVDKVMDAFSGSRDIKIDGNGYSLSYTYFRGPAIDERLITITKENQ